jgi:hypothetical protein
MSATETGRVEDIKRSALSRMMSQVREDCGDKPRGETDHDVLDKRQEVGDPPEGLGGDVLVCGRGRSPSAFAVAAANQTASDPSSPGYVTC